MKGKITFFEYLLRNTEFRQELKNVLFLLLSGDKQKLCKK